MDRTTGPSRRAALERMTEALEAAKRVRDRGGNVQIARAALKTARAALEAGDYVAAMERADYILSILGSAPASALSLAQSPPSSALPANADIASGRRWIDQATESVREAKGRGLNVRVAKAALSEAKRALKAADYQAAIEFANQAIRLCSSATPARR